MSKRHKGIYCLEIGEWFGSLKAHNTVEPILSLLNQSPLHVKYIHRDIATASELRYYLRKWVQDKHHDYPILYLAFHGNPGSIQVATENGRPLAFETDELFQLLSGKCRGRIIHFGACSVLNIHGHTVNRYLRESGAVAISGYAASVDWMRSSILEMLYLSELQGNQFTTTGIRAVRRRVRASAARLTQSLKFQVRIRK